MHLSLQEDNRMHWSASQRRVHMHECPKLKGCMQTLPQTRLSSLVQGSEKATWTAILDHSMSIIGAILQCGMCCHLACTGLWYM